MDEALERAKAAAAERAVGEVRAGQRLALGTGSTAAHAVRALAAKFPGASLECVASSKATEALARSLGLAVRELRASDRFDRMIDGADEVDPSLEMIKGGGGALLREKLLAQLSQERVILVDPTKLVRHLADRVPVPVEVVPFTRPVLERTLTAEGYGVWHRKAGNGRPFLTDNGNEILDVRPTKTVEDPRRLAGDLRDRTGVVEVGIFLGLADRVLVGAPDGSVEERRRPGGTTA